MNVFLRFFNLFNHLDPIANGINNNLLKNKPKNIFVKYFSIHLSPLIVLNIKKK